jgi:hypothetical protein
MDEIWQRALENLLGRLNGPLHFRFLMQPAVALFFGIRDGLKDAREGRPAYLWTIFTKPEHRGWMLREGLRAVAKVLVLALVLDAVYQAIELHWFYPGGAIIVATVLAFVPYLLIRGPVNRIARRWRAPHPSSEPSVRTTK